MKLFAHLFPARQTVEPDLLDHPDLKRMTLRQLADLPMPRVADRPAPEPAPTKLDTF